MTGNSPAPQAPTLFYGWVLVAVLLILLSLGQGVAIYMYSLVAGAVNTEFGATRFMLMLGSTGMFLMIGLCSPVLGRLLDRYPSKGILLAGAIAMGLGFMLVALSVHIWMVVASYVVFLGVGAAILSPLATSTLLSRWFVRRRGLAIGIATLGTQFGGFVFPPIVAATMEAYSWRIAIGGLGLAILVILPPVIWLLVVDRPENKGQLPDGQSLPVAAEGQGAAPRPVAPKLGFAELLLQRNFLLVVAIVGVVVATNTLLLTNLALFAAEVGETPARGALLVSLTSLLGIAFSPLVGWLCDTISIRLVAALVTLFLALACFIFGVANTYPLLLLATFFQGVGGGGVFPLWASLVGHLYHTRVYGQVMGSVTLLISISTAMAPVLGGWSYDVTGGYRFMFLVLLALLILVLLLTPLLRVPRDQGEKFGAALA